MVEGVSETLGRICLAAVGYASLPPSGCCLIARHCTLMAAASALLGRVLLISRSYVENRMPQSQPAGSGMRFMTAVTAQSKTSDHARIMEREGAAT